MTSTLGMSRTKANGPSVAPRKLVIKPLKSRPQLPADFEARTWGKLREAVLAVHAKRPVSCSLEELYGLVEDMCLHKMADRLYANLQKECDFHVSEQLTRLATDQTMDPVLFLEKVAACWKDHCDQMLIIRSIFLYLDRTYVISTSGVRSLFEMGLQLFGGHLAQHPEVERKTVVGLLQLIEAERNGDTVDRVLIAHLLRCFTSLGIYETAFQAPFLQQTSEYYAAEGLQYMATTEVAEYLLHCERRLTEEYERCQHYLDASTRKPLISAVEAQLLERHMAAILEKGFNGLMAEGRVPDLARLFGLCSRIHALDSLKAAFRAYIKKAGIALIMDEEKDKDMVKLLLDMKERLDTVLIEAFGRAEAFGHALKDAFEHFINQRANRPAELVAKFMDERLRGGQKGQSDEELDNTLDKALMLFRYIQGKDVFEAFYKKDLAKRLLLGKSASTDAEKAMITKLKAECGSQFTNKLEGMFKDVDLSRDIMTSFRQSASSRAKCPAGLDMSVHILTSGYWPTYPVLEAKLPVELTQYQTVFKDFYLSKHSGRRLVWHNSLGTCTVRAHFSKGVKELSVSLFQTVVLMLFNDADALSFEDIKAASGIEDRELRRTLQSLACGKTRVITKEPKGREVEDGDMFRFNADFTAQLFRIKINAIQLKETVEENKKTNDQVLQDRQYQIDAAIVRVMKTRKSLSHKLLVSELLTQLKFPMKQSDLKKRIESLIDREYLERDRENPNVYNYLA
ncbi:Cullin-4 [Coccomyxa sp. Obi]|nr:Cullin-4 [Coccomyxa sp. Obi]